MHQGAVVNRLDTGAKKVRAGRLAARGPDQSSGQRPAQALAARGQMRLGKVDQGPRPYRVALGCQRWQQDLDQQRVYLGLLRPEAVGRTHCLSNSRISSGNRATQ